MLTHRSGLSGEPPSLHWETLPIPRIEEILAGMPRIAVVIEPDSAFEYSNLAFSLPGEVVACIWSRWAWHLASGI
ncbi:MAG: hypothetical protein EXR62_12795 [Chloroflexi bacterium]|nr:hypothetical protein [Chloroflexota bacterium]